MKHRAVIGLGLAAAIVAGCGGGSGSTQSTATHPASTARSTGFDNCLRPGPDVRVVKVPAPGEQLPVVELGSGTTGVVFANQSASIACGWLPYARNVARSGVRSVVFDYGTASREGEVLAIAHGIGCVRIDRRVGVGGGDRTTHFIATSRRRPRSSPIFMPVTVRLNGLAISVFARG